jgi:hypothetical protein
MRTSGVRGVAREYREIWQETRSLAVLERDLPAAEIYRRIVRKFKDRDPLPDERRVRAWVTGARQDPSGPWSFGPDSDLDDARAVLGVLASVVEETEGRREYVTVDEAEWIARVVAISPDIPPLTAFRLATQYRLNTPHRAATEGLDLYVAFAPWRDGGRRYTEAIKQGWIGTVAWFSEDEAALYREADQERQAAGRSVGRVKELGLI